ncbi:hypothetical protein [Ornithinibacillus xuwenensis]|uniref:Uncharacterized protein n=1 Tax=Ornithinibacillus xuwenensis TaxID=3144668 RepID=A0ABU9XC04_9BACI
MGLLYIMGLFLFAILISVSTKKNTRLKEMERSLWYYSEGNNDNGEKAREALHLYGKNGIKRKW